MIGKVVSHYKVLEKIGQGGMGEIWLAEDTKLGRKVALKFLSEKFTLKESARERFNREARAAAALNHPGIVTVYEINEFEGLIYIAMEYVEGETLAEKMRFADTEMDDKTVPLDILQALPINDIVEIMLEVCRGLQKAHGAGIVHRDIKLDNIMIGRDGRVKILDFGLARLKGVSRLTEDSVTMGTAYYMSPEQVQGEEFDHRTDIWSLGVVIYLMTTGRFPFEGKTTLDTMFAITGKAPEPIRRINKIVPQGLESIVKGCLKKKADDRYQNMSDLIADLEKIRDSLISGKSAHIPGPPRMKVLRTPAFKIAAALLLAAALTLFLLLSPATSLKIKKLLGFSVLPAQKHVAVLPLTVMGEDSLSNRAFADGLIEDITRKLILLERFDQNLLVVPTRKLRSRGVESNEKAKQHFGVDLAINGIVERGNERLNLTLSLVEAKGLNRIDSWTIDRHKSDLCDIQEDLVVQVARMMEIEPDADMLEILNAGCASVPGAFDRYLQGLGYLQHNNNVGNIDLAIGLFTEAIKSESKYALAYAGLGEAYYLKYGVTKEKQWADAAIINCRKALEKENRLVCAYITLGKIFNDAEQYVEAIEAFQRALEINPVEAEALYWIAKIEENRGRFAEAEEAFRTATRLRPRDFSVHNNMGAFYLRQNRLEEARPTLEQALILNPNYLHSLINLGHVYFSLKRWDKARPLLERSLTIKPNYIAYSNLGTLYFYQGYFDLAVQRFKKALELRKSDFRIWGYLAESYYWLGGNADEVRTNYEKAADLAQKELAKKPDDSEIMSELASYYIRLENSAMAMSFLERVVKMNNLTPKVMLTIANSYEQMGNRDEALRWIEFALDEDIPMIEIKHNPGLYDLRSDPRYQEILKRVKESKKSKNGQSSLKRSKNK